MRLFDFKGLQTAWAAVPEGKAKLFPVYLAAFVTILLASNILAVKLIQVGPIILTAAVFLFPVSYIFGDVLTEVYGYAGSRKIIWLGLGANILMVLAILMGIVLPHPVFWKGQDAFASTLGLVPRIVAASLVAYLCGEFFNSFVISKLKEWQIKWDPQHVHLWIRTVASTIVGEGVDSTIFVLAAFSFFLPWNVVLPMIFWQWVFKCGVEIVMTPITYFIVAGTKHVEGLDVVGAKSYSPFRWASE